MRYKRTKQNKRDKRYKYGYNKKGTYPKDYLVYIIEMDLRGQKQELLSKYNLSRNKYIIINVARMDKYFSNVVKLDNSKILLLEQVKEFYYKEKGFNPLFSNRHKHIKYKNKTYNQAYRIKNKIVKASVNSNYIVI